MILSKTDAINILKADHKAVKDLFEQFKKAETKREKSRIVQDAIMELKIHTTIEEEIFYPAVRQALKKSIGKDETTDLMDEADEEHHVAKLLIAELETMKASDDHWEGKFTVLSENVVHHIKEEEHDMFPKARMLDLDYDAMGDQILLRKDELKAKGVPAFAEQALIAKYGIADSPAEAARTR